jgi:predicted lipoprotein with Yx(FWY)xxD motif
MFWRTGAIIALVAALLLAALPAYATPPGGDNPASAVELTGMKVGDNFYFDTKSGSLKSGQEAFFKIYDSGTNKPLGVTLNYRPWTPEAWPSATIEDPMVMFAVWTPVWADGQWKLKEVGNSTPSSQPSGVKYWRGGTNVARTYYIQMRNYGPMAIDYAIAFTGPLYPPPALDIKPVAEAKANIMTSEKASLGKFLVDSAGMTLYTFTKDSPSQSTCYDACATNWPVFFVEKPMPGAGTMASDFATITRTDGKKQTTYKGWPLYYWAKDIAKGDTTGHGVNGVWFVANTTP